MKPTLKILSYNIHKGRTFFLRKKFWDFLENLFFYLKPDLIFLQEFFREPDAERLLENLADKLWVHQSYGQNATSGDYHYGNAILSKSPILESENISISTNMFEQRGLLYATIHPPDCPRIHLACTHLNLTRNGRQLQAHQISNFLKSRTTFDSPLILAGDFNDWGNHLHLRIEKDLELQDAALTHQKRLVATFPSLFPLFSLDKIYSRHFRVVYSNCLFNQKLKFQSDHLPILAELQPLSYK